MAPSVAAARDAWAAALRAAGCAESVPAEDVPVTLATGRVTAGAVHAAWSLPAWPCAAMDGVAVTAADTADAPVVLGPGRFDDVDTGDPLPAGRDAVVMREHLVRRPDGAVALRAPVPPGRHVRAVGEDIPAGRRLLPAGHRLRPVDVAAAAAAGLRSLPVRRRPVVVIVPTGDEVRPVGDVLRPGEVLDTNSVMLAATLREAGCAARVAPIQPDVPDRISAAVRDAAADADLVAVLAGSSAGRDDHTAAVVAGLGTVVVHGVAVRPAHPTLLGVLAGPPPVPVLGVPGYPVAAALALQLFALPLLADLQRAAAAPPPMAAVVLAADVPSRVGVDEHVLLAVDAEGAAEPLRRGAGALGALVAADAVLRLPPDDGGRRAGETAVVTLIGGAPAHAAVAPAQPLGRSAERAAVAVR